MTLLLMAAGNGSRYGKLKQFDDLGPHSEFLMEFSIFDAIKYGFTHIVAITKKDKVDFLKEHLSKRLPNGIKLDVLAQEISDVPEHTNYTTERLKPWGTAHAVWTARNVIKGPFAVINADDFYGELAFKNAARIMNSETENTFGLISYTLKDTLSTHGSVSRGVCQIENGILTKVEERLKIEKQNNSIIDTDSGIVFTGEEEASMNFWVCDTSIFNYITNAFKLFLKDEEKIKSSEIFLPFIVQEMISKKNLKVPVLNSESNWFGVTYAEDRAMAVSKLAEMTKNEDYPFNLWNIN
ncbi:MAG: sugar phosphate nucleotidyltransferase [Cellulophaga fucicola]